MIKRTYKSLSSTRLLRLWREERERRKAEAACRQLARDLTPSPLGSEAKEPAKPTIPATPLVSLEPPAKLSDREARSLARREEHARLRKQAEQERREAKAPAHAFRLNEQPWYGIGRQEQDHVENPVKRPFENEMVAWLNEKHIVIKRLEDWRWLDSKLFGQIHGLPRSRGRAMMANGVFVLIERADGSVFWGHECHWVEDEDLNKVSTKRSERAKMNAILGAKLRELLAM